MHGNVIQIAERVQQFPPSSYEDFPSPLGFPAGEYASKEVRCVAERLGLNPHFMPARWIELDKVNAPFQKLPPASPQLTGGGTSNRAIAHRAGKFVDTERPVASLHPGCRIKHKTTKAFGFDGR